MVPRSLPAFDPHPIAVMLERGHLPTRWQAFRPTLGADSRIRRACALLVLIHMATSSSSSRRVADIIGRIFNRFVAVTVGIVLMIVGLGMMATIVALPVGVVLELLGVLIFVYGFLTPADGSERGGSKFTRRADSVNLPTGISSSSTYTGSSPSSFPTRAAADCSPGSTSRVSCFGLKTI